MQGKMRNLWRGEMGMVSEDLDGSLFLPVGR